MSTIKSLTTRILKVCKRYTDTRKMDAGNDWDRGWNAAVKALAEAIQEEIDMCPKVGDGYPLLALAVVRLHAQELGLDVVAGNDRMMASIPLNPSEGDKLIEAAFPTVVEIPQLTPVGDAPIGPGDVF